MTVTPMTRTTGSVIPHPYSSEHTLTSPQLQRFWQQITTGELAVSPEITLAYMAVTHPSHKRTLVLSNGRVESYLKYQEVIYDCYRQGYNVYALDHRGQGLSSRLTLNPHKGHVEHFDDYIDDFEKFIEQVVLPAQAQDSPLFLLGHSMGCAISSLYVARNPHTFSAAAFSAPMYGIRLPAPKPAILWLATWLDKFRRDGEPNYVPGGCNYRQVAFEKNELTHCQIRYRRYQQLYNERPELQLGSPTNRWLTESIKAAEYCVNSVKHSTVPMLILQADEDTIVDNTAQDRAIGENAQRVIVHGARHEILFESDNIRNHALNSLFDFFQQYA